MIFGSLLNRDDTFTDVSLRWWPLKPVHVLIHIDILRYEVEGELSLSLSKEYMTLKATCYVWDALFTFWRIRDLSKVNFYQNTELLPEVIFSMNFFIAVSLAMLNWQKREEQC